MSEIKMSELLEAEMVEAGGNFPHMNGQMVFKHATRRFCEAINEVLEKGGADIGDVRDLDPLVAGPLDLLVCAGAALLIPLIWPLG